MDFIIWEFTVREEYIPKFIAVYDSNGDWANFFRQSEGYLGTDLLRSSQHTNIFLTIDRWKNIAYFEALHAQFTTEYKKLDAQLENFTLSERKIGIFSGS